MTHYQKNMLLTGNTNYGEAGPSLPWSDSKIFNPIPHHHTLARANYYHFLNMWNHWLHHTIFPRGRGVALQCVLFNCVVINSMNISNACEWHLYILTEISDSSMKPLVFTRQKWVNRVWLIQSTSLYRQRQTKHKYICNLAMWAWAVCYWRNSSKRTWQTLLNSFSW